MACARLHPEHLDVAGGRLREAEDHVDRGGLAGAVGAEERDDLARLDLEVDAADGVDAAEVLGDPGQADCRERRRGRGERGPESGGCHDTHGAVAP